MPPLSTPSESQAAFNAGSAALSVPTSELLFLRQLLPNPEVTTSNFATFLSRLNLSNNGLSTALYTLAAPTPPVTPANLITLYATLRQFALHPSPDALYAALWLAFRAAGGLASLSFMQWKALSEEIGLAVGGIDSPPCEETLREMRKEWIMAKGPLWSLMSSRLRFDTFAALLIRDHSGFVECLSAMGFVLTCAVIDASDTHVSKPHWSGDSESCHLSQYLTFAIERAMENKERTDWTDNPHRDNADVGESTEEEEEQVATSTSWLEELGHFGSSFSNASPGVQDPAGVSGDSLSLERKAEKIITGTEVGACSVSEVRRGLEKLLRRTRGGSNASSPFHIDFSSLNFEERIGSGAYGEVYRGTFLMSPVAIKVFHVKAATADEMTGGLDDDPSHMSRKATITALRRFASENSRVKYKNFVREVEMMSVVRHPNLVLYMGACGDPDTPLCIVSELFTGGSLYEYLHNVKPFRPDLKTAMSFALNIARGMFYLHASQPSILHRDLKSRNVLLSGKKGVDGIPHVVICDFGLCELFGEEFENGGSEQMAMGTASYMSPDVISGSGYEARDDVYSYGILLHEIFTGCVPYGGERPVQVMYGVSTEGRRPTCENEKYTPESIMELMHECWDRERDRRPSFDGIIQRLNEIEQRLPELGVV